MGGRGHQQGSFFFFFFFFQLCDIKKVGKIFPKKRENLVIFKFFKKIKI